MEKEFRKCLVVQKSRVLSNKHFRKKHFVSIALAFFVYPLLNRGFDVTGCRWFRKILSFFHHY